jgi:hypothetical protein
MRLDRSIGQKPVLAKIVSMAGGASASCYNAALKSVAMQGTED